MAHANLDTLSPYENFRRKLFSCSYAAHIFRTGIRKKYGLSSANSRLAVIEWCEPRYAELAEAKDKKVLWERETVGLSDRESEWYDRIHTAEVPHTFTDIAKATIPEITAIAESLLFNENHILAVVADDYLKWAGETQEFSRILRLNRIDPERGLPPINQAGIYLYVDEWTQPKDLKPLLKEAIEILDQDSKVKIAMAQAGLWRPGNIKRYRVRNRANPELDMPYEKLYALIEQSLIICHEEDRSKDPVSWALGRAEEVILSDDDWTLTYGIPMQNDETDWLYNSIEDIYYRLCTSYAMPTYKQVRQMANSLVL